MYHYRYETVELETKFFSGYILEEHKKIIAEYAADGWRFVTAIPKKIIGYGVIKELDLVFEKEEARS